MQVKIKLPRLYLITVLQGENLIQGLGQPATTIDADLANYSTPKLKGSIIIPKDQDLPQILVIKKGDPGNDFQSVIRFSSEPSVVDGYLDLTTGLWLKHPDLQTEAENATVPADVVASWINGFSFISEDEDKNIEGLREPQIGAIHAIHAHWTVTNAPATIVMPTGTGKTETMICVLVSRLCRRVLIVVPTDALRTQIAEKFITFGILKNLNVIGPACRYPTVGVLKNRPKNFNEVDDFFQRCNVVITTPHIVGQASKRIQERIANHCSELFIDEAHHGGAETWRAVKERFAEKRILQFTATPFREDDKPIGDKIIFKYPLTRAQEKKYFTRIDFKPVRVFAKKKRDKVIAELAVKQLREDLKSYNHILMARVNSIKRAKEVYAVYEEYSEFNPVQIHTDIKAKKTRDEIKRKLLTAESRIVVCVDMLGEGFDLPELKIAAFHDIKKSPTVTIQLAGRFTRARKDLGNATFIANVGDEEVRSELKKLYTREPDWNFLLPKLSEELIQEQLDLNKLAEGFLRFPKDIPIQTLNPALSTVIYKTKCLEWSPDSFVDGLPSIGPTDKRVADINEDGRTLIIITARKVEVKWARVEEIFNWDWELYVVFWDKDQNLLFINNSNNSGDFKKLAHAVAGPDAKLVRGENVFRSFGRMNRIVFKNIGLSEHLGRLVSFTGRMGSNVEPVLTELQKQKASKSLLVGTGYEGGERVSIGCSAKGRIWSHARSFHLNRLIEWCSLIGNKILDETIDPNQFLKNTLVSHFVVKRPQLMPFGITWHEDIYKASETAITFRFADGTDKQLYEIDIDLIAPSESGDLLFLVRSDEIEAQFKLTLSLKHDVEEFDVSLETSGPVSVVWGTAQMSAETFFYEYPPTIWFVDGSELSGSKYTVPIKEREQFERAHILSWDWTGTNIQKESQKTEKRKESVQYRVINEIKNGDYDVIFDDDASGEAADVVAIKVNDRDRIINVELYHCKFSGAEAAGARVDDLYEVCGQSQKSVRWYEHPRELFLHLLRREEKRLDEEKVTRIENGSSDDIDEIAEKSLVYKTELHIFIVQPGLSKSKASLAQLDLLSVTENYLKDMYLIPLTVVGSN
jgi:superfamily II DNA or RNA helicase